MPFRIQFFELEGPRRRGAKGCCRFLRNSIIT